MYVLKNIGAALCCVLTMLAFSQQASASECGLSCCIAAGVDGVSGKAGFNASVQLDVMDMTTIKQGTSNLTQAQVFATSNKMMFSIPTKMTMQKIALNTSYRMDENNVFLLTVPYLINDMDMKMKNGKTMSMDTIEGLGDVSLTYLRDVYKDTDIRTRQRLSLAVGVKAPTGQSDTRNAKNELMHMMMQTGTGSWDFFAIANGVVSFGEHEDGGALWMVSPTLMYQINGRNDLGYKVGDRLNYDVSTRYRFTSAFNIKLDLNGVWAQQDSTNGSIDATSGLVAYQNPMMSLIDNVNNTGLNSLFITPGFQWIVSPQWNISAEYRLPIYQNVKGIQQVTDHWYFVRASVHF